MKFTLVQHEHAAASVELPKIEYDPTLAFIHPKLIEAFAYWNACCGSRSMPRRADLNPVAMRGFITHIGLFEVRREGDGSVDYFVRLTGAQIEDVFGRRAGRMLTDGVPSVLVQRWQKPNDMVLETGRPLRARGRIAWQDKTWIDGEALYAPLGDLAAAPDMIFFGFAVLSTKPTIGAN